MAHAFTRCEAVSRPLYVTERAQATEICGQVRCRALQIQLMGKSAQKGIPQKVPYRKAVRELYRKAQGQIGYAERQV